MNPKYIVNWHHEAICHRLTKLKEQRGKKIMIFVGPQRGKSEIVSRNFPAWWIGNFPKSKNILSSYSGDLANSFNKDVQAIVGDKKYKDIFPNIVTGFDNPKLKLAANQMVTGDKGYLYSVGVGGSTTGFSAGEMASNNDDGDDNPGCFICDDPIKDLAEVFSEAIMRNKMNWWRAVVSTRIHNTSNTILMHTRWSQKDIAGQILEAKQKGWEVLSFPELGPDRDYPNKYDPRKNKNDPLWPDEKGDYDKLMQIKEEVGSYTWAALFQQKPKVEGGNIIKEEWINVYSLLPFDIEKIRSSSIIQSWDLQFKKTGTSYTVGGTIIKNDADFYLVDFYRKKADIIESQRAITKMALAWPRCNTILVEDKANGPAIITLLKRKVTGIIPVKPTTSKDERLHSVAPIFEAGNFHIPSNHPQTQTIIDELTTFPMAANDDIVDMISQALNHFSKLKGIRHLRESVK